MTTKEPCCLSCETCETCDGCESPCNICQNYCENVQNSNNKFKFTACVSSGQIIGTLDDELKGYNYFNRNRWNDAIKRINNVFTTGKEDGWGNTISLCSNSEEFISAQEFNRVASAADFFNTGVEQNGVIYGSYYEKLQTYIKNLNYKNTQCEKCNIVCDITCDECQLCNISCNGCNTSSDVNIIPCGDCCDEPSPCQSCDVGDCPGQAGFCPQEGATPPPPV